MRVGFVGAGNLGAPIAHMIIDAGWPVTLYARRPERLAIFDGTGATRAQSLAELGAQADLVAIMVMDDAQTEEVVLQSGLLEAMAPGSIITILSTIAPDTCRRLAERAGEKGISVLDAPVTGGAHIQTLVLSKGLRLNDPPNTAVGQDVTPGLLAVMVGGDRAAYERALPVFRSFGRVIHHFGEVGNGQIAKLCNNLLVYANIATAAEAMDLGRRLGLDETQLLDVMRTGIAASTALESYGPKFDLSVFENTNRGMSKDIQLAQHTARARGVDAYGLDRIAERALRWTLREEDRPALSAAKL